MRLWRTEVAKHIHTLENLDPVFKALLAEYRIPMPDFEVKFAPPRKWSFDMAWIDMGVAIEVHGGIWSGGRHIRPKGFLNDREKINAALALGWSVLEFTSEQLRYIEAIETIMLVAEWRRKHVSGWKPKIKVIK